MDGMADRRAILTDDGALTYGDVQALANRFGNLLKDQGVRPEPQLFQVPFDSTPSGSAQPGSPG